MVKVIADDLLVCSDCANLIANDEATDEHRAAVREEMIKKDMPRGTWVLGDDVIDFATEPCDYCGDPLAGGRMNASVLD